MNRRKSAPPLVTRRAGAARVLRIIGGAWRGRKLRFPAASAIRPTPDRVRETLFNWLAAAVPGARCLDLYAGSGALGLEALSRGAAHVTFVERDAAAVAALREVLQEWQSPDGHAGRADARIERGDALAFLAGPPRPFDIVFLDPPFDSGLLPRSAELLGARGWLAPGALAYVESPARAGLPVLPPGWRPLKSGRAGEVGYHLFAYAEAQQAP